MFSSRVPADLRMNQLAAAIQARRAAGSTLFDLTLTNPTTAGIDYPRDLLAPLADAAALTYRPEPFGLRSAREAVAGLGVAVSADRVVLTASTSEAYSLLFKLLCDPGDEVLIPVPSYPLFEHLSTLDAVQTRPYSVEYHGQWMVDEHSVDASWTDRVRAVLAVSPNNPTGSVLTGREWNLLASRCAERDAALIVDEVFAEFSLSDSVAQGFSPADCLTFRLGGLSKSIGLPQVKLGWIVVDGPDALVRDALDRLEIICDTYLSVSTPVQVAAPALIEGGAKVRDAILARVRGNLATLETLTSHYASVTLLRPDAGWSAVLRIPSTHSEEETVLALLEEDDVLVHPGYFFDFPTEAYLVVSLLPPPDVFEEGVRRLLNRVHG
jgi:alanine-synthesizing transaminase